MSHRRFDGYFILGTISLVGGLWAIHPALDAVLIGLCLLGISYERFKGKQS